MQLLTHLFGGEVERADKQEFDKAELLIDDSTNALYQNIPNKTRVWMSHGDHVTKIAEGFEVIVHTDSCVAAVVNKEKRLYAFQYHPEVTHSEQGAEMLANFVFNVANCEKNWSMGNYIESTVKEIKERVGNKKVILGLSGGVDSSVAAAAGVLGVRIKIAEIEPPNIAPQYTPAKTIRPVEGLIPKVIGIKRATPIAAESPGKAPMVIPIPTLIQAATKFIGLVAVKNPNNTSDI